MGKDTANEWKGHEKPQVFLSPGPVPPVLAAQGGASGRKGQEKPGILSEAHRRGTWRCRLRCAADRLSPRKRSSRRVGGLNRLSVRRLARTSLGGGAPRSLVHHQFELDGLSGQEHAGQAARGGQRGGHLARQGEASVGQVVESVVRRKHPVAPDADVKG